MAYKIDLAQIKLFTKKSLLSLTNKEIQDYLFNLRNIGYSQKTINRKFAALKSFYNFYLRQNSIDKLPYKGVHLVRSIQIKEKKQYFIDRHIVLTILDNICPGGNRKKMRDKLVLELLYFTGCRADEIIRLKKRNVDYSNCLIKVIGKGREERLVPINKLLVDLIRVHLKMWRAKNKGPYVLNNNSGKRIGTMFLWRLIRRYFATDITKVNVSAHILRHSIATHLYFMGASIKGIKQLLGHKYYRSTSIYLHPNIEHLKKVYSKCFVKS